MTRLSQWFSDRSSYEEAWTTNLTYYSGYKASGLQVICRKMSEGLLQLELRDLKIVFEGRNKWISTELMERYRPKLKAIASKSKKSPRSRTTGAAATDPIES